MQLAKNQDALPDCKSPGQASHLNEINYDAVGFQIKHVTPEYFLTKKKLNRSIFEGQRGLTLATNPILCLLLKLLKALIRTL